MDMFPALQKDSGSDLKTAVLFSIQTGRQLIGAAALDHDSSSLEKSLFFGSAGLVPLLPEFSSSR